MDLEEVRRAKAAHVEALLRKKNVVGCGVRYKEVGGVRTEELAVVVSVVRKVPEETLSLRDAVPERLEGVKTDVRETGAFRAMQEPTGKWPRSSISWWPGR